MTLQEELQHDVTELRGLLERLSTRSVVGMCFSSLITAQQENRNSRLHSPDRQISFLLSVLLSTREPETPAKLTEEEWRRMEVLLNDISSVYFKLYFQKGEGETTAEWYQVREVAMSAFLHYFNSGLMASIEQVNDRIAAYLAVFDTDLTKLIGIAATDATKIGRFIAKKLQADLDGLQRLATEEEALRHAILDRADSEGLSLDDLKWVEWKEPWAGKAIEFWEGIQSLGLIKFKELEAEFPAMAAAYWERFTIRRGDGPAIQFPTDKRAIDTRPLILIDDETALFPGTNALFLATMRTGEEALVGSELRQQFLRARDKTLEREVARNARLLFGENATIWEHVFEQPDSQFEHDLIVFDEELCIIFEAKASPPAEPFRDPDKAFTRIRDAFRGDTGIQKAFEQGNHIVSRLNRGEVVRLFGANGSEIGQLLPTSSKLVCCACITRDDFGPLATNLSLLLEKEPDDAYPWAVNIVDLSTLAEAWGYFRWGSLELRRYLEQRLKVHGKVFSPYELDFAGCFVRHGGFQWIQRENTPNYERSPLQTNGLGPKRVESFPFLGANCESQANPAAPTTRQVN